MALSSHGHSGRICFHFCEIAFLHSPFGHKLVLGVLLAPLLCSALLITCSQVAEASVLLCCLDDIDVDVSGWDGSNSPSNNDNVRVYNSAGPNYTVTATGSGGNFTLSRGGDSFAYQVWWKDSSGSGGSYTQLTSGGSSGTFGNAVQSPADCSSCAGSPNANIKIVLPSTELAKASVGNYSSTLTILITPG